MATRRKSPENLVRLIFDAIPSPIFVVDDDVQIHEYNTAAASFLAAERATIFRRRGGEALHCLHSRDVPEGCGRAPYCKNCVIRNSVKEAIEGNRVIRRQQKLELVRDGTILEIHALITASPFLFQGTQLVLLAVEDVSEIVELRRLIPICAICKKVRNDKDYWVLVESYFEEHLDVDFTHGLCPDCYKKQMDELEKMDKAEQSDGGDS